MIDQDLKESRECVSRVVASRDVRFATTLCLPRVIYAPCTRFLLGVPRNHGLFKDLTTLSDSRRLNRSQYRTTLSPRLQKRVVDGLSRRHAQSGFDLHQATHKISIVGPARFGIHDRVAVKLQDALKSLVLVEFAAVCRRKGRVCFHQLHGQDTQRPRVNILGRVVGFAAQQLGRDECGSAAKCGMHVTRLPPGCPSKVAKIERVVIHDENVLGLDVAVGDL